MRRQETSQVFKVRPFYQVIYIWDIGPREILALVDQETDSSRAFIRQLAWRDWYAHLMNASPEILNSPANPVYKNIEWRNNTEEFDLWVQGKQVTQSLTQGCVS